MYSLSRISHYRSHSNPAIELSPLLRKAEYHPGKQTAQTPTIHLPIKFLLNFSSISTFHPATCKVFIRLSQLLEMLFIYQFFDCNKRNKSIQGNTVP